MGYTFCGHRNFLGSLAFFVFFFALTNTVLNTFFLSGVNSLFVVTLLVAIVNGVILYWLNRLVVPKLRIPMQVLTVCEYIIQWSLIYITVYQVMFDNIVKKNLLGEVTAIATLNITNPADLMIVVLPSLISTWVGIIFYKLHCDKL